jgi:hypothetical protein
MPEYVVMGAGLQCGRGVKVLRCIVDDGALAWWLVAGCGGIVNGGWLVCASFRLTLPRSPTSRCAPIVIGGSLPAARSLLALLLID